MGSDTTVTFKIFLVTNTTVPEMLHCPPPAHMSGIFSLHFPMMSLHVFHLSAQHPMELS